jgi:hypothetical protein
MIVLDVDGTLINDEKIITPKTKDALIAVQRQGVIVVLASGRPSPGLLGEEKYHGLLLSYNGGKVIDATTQKVIYQKSIPRETATRLLKHLETFPVTPIMDDGKYIYTTDEDAYQIRYESQNNNLKIKIVNNLADDINFCPIKILIAAPNEVLLSASKKIMAPFENELSFTLSAPFYLKATMKGVSKASSLRIICNILNIKPEEVMAFGDAQNDIPIACEELKAIADEVTLSNNEDGIAHTLKKYYEI